MIGCKLLPLRSESMAVSQYLKDMIMGVELVIATSRGHTANHCGCVLEEKAFDQSNIGDSK